MPSVDTLPLRLAALGNGELGTVLPLEIRHGFVGLLAAALLAASSLSADARRVRDVQPGPGSGLFHEVILITPPEIDTSFFAPAGSLLFFSADDGVHGAELWRSDGTEQGTVLVRDIHPGPGSALAFTAFPPWVDLGKVLYFVADDGVHGAELWRSDGTEQGTVLVKDIRPGPDHPRLTRMVAGGDVVFFVADDGVNGQALWKSDGTPEGTRIVLDVNPSALPFSIGALTWVGGTLYFGANDGTTGMELWKSDGTPGGTVLVQDIEPGIGGSNPLVFDVDLDSPGPGLGKPVLFRARLGGLGTPGIGVELWKTTGTPAGTELIKDIREGDQSSSPGGFVTASGLHFFTAASDRFDVSARLWTTDGTADGTVRVPLPGEIADVGMHLLTATDNRVFFVAGETLWSHDARTGGTQELFSVSDRHISVVKAQGKWMIWFAHNSGSGLRELWATDGTPQGVVLLDKHPDVAEPFLPPLLAVVKNTVFFDAFDADAGRELWQVDLVPLLGSRGR